MEDDWSSKDNEEYYDDVGGGFRYYTKDIIETLRLKLIDDIEKSIFIDTGHDDIIAIINKRFGVDE